jgi:predicted CXXCH cytochrome family protein
MQALEWVARGRRVRVIRVVPRGGRLHRRALPSASPDARVLVRRGLRCGLAVPLGDVRGEEVVRPVLAACFAALAITAAVWGSMAGPHPRSATGVAIDLGGDRAQVGFDAPVTIEVAASGAEALAGQIAWRQIEGPPLADLRVEERGFRLHARTLPFATLHPEAVPAGVVPISPRTQGRYVLEAVWSGPGSPPARQTVTLTSIARATGLPSLAVSQAVLLGGAGWRVVRSALGGHAEVEAESDLARFAPDAPGEWQLEDEAGHRLSLRASTHDKTPYDCGRSECHASIADATVPTAMSHAFERTLAAPGAFTCTLDCHVVGERGLHDGGFLDVARSLGFAWSTRPAWKDLPRALRRLGGVRCSSCHGPGAIPPREARWTVLRSDVCATCHDAPPSYTHVAEWRAGRMARSDALTGTRTNPTCARCHTTAGFLQSAGVRKGDSHDESAGEALGIACAACHAPHGAHEGDALVRTVSGGSSVCVPCHSPLPDEEHPSASSATLWAGVAVLPDGERAGAPSPHAGLPRGCVGCHGARAGGGAIDHSFRVDPRTCNACHADGKPRERPDATGQRVHDRAVALLALLREKVGAGAPSLQLTRALYEVELVVEDPAAGVHNAPFARSLLSDAAAILSGPP